MASESSETVGIMTNRFSGEFRRSFFKRFDRRFVLILAIVAVVLGSFTLIMSLQPVTDTATQEQILRIQERYAKLVLDQQLPKPEAKIKEPLEQTSVQQKAEEKKELSPTPQPKVDRAKETVAQRRRRKAQTREQRTQKREMIAQEVRSSGLFAAITATGSGIDASAVGASDLLGAVEEIGAVEVGGISSGGFATKKTEGVQISGPRGERTGGITIEKKSVGSVETKQIVSKAEVAISSQPPQLTGESKNSARRSQSSINSVVQRETRRLKRVYENWLKRDPKLSGQLKIKFTIMPDGSVANVSIVKSTTNNDEFDRNIMRYVGRWKFDEAPEAGLVEVVYPFAFEGAV